MAKYDHKEFEKDIPKKERDIMLQHVFFVGKGGGHYEPFSANPFAPEPIQAAMILNMSWRIWRKQKRRLEKEHARPADLPSVS